MADQRAEPHQKLYERLDVIRDSGHDTSDGNAIVERSGTQFHMGKKIVSHVAKGEENDSGQRDAVKVVEAVTDQGERTIDDTGRSNFRKPRRLLHPKVELK